MKSDLAAIHCAFCAGNPRDVYEAFGQGYKRAFRSGRFSHAYVEFQDTADSADLQIYLSGAIAAATDLPEVPMQSQELGGEEGLWGVELMSEAWVQAVAAIPDDKIETVRDFLVDQCQKDCGRLTEGWQVNTLSNELRGLVTLARQSVSERGPLMLLWEL
mgnify:CR=1 FL=1